MSIPDAYSRYRYMERLASEPPTPETLATLVRALADEEYAEHPGDYDAPTFVYSVAEAAATALGERAPLVIEQLVQQMRASENAAFYCPRLFAHCGEQGIAPVLELLDHPAPMVRKQAVLAARRLPRNRQLEVALLRRLADPDLDVVVTTLEAVKACPDTIRAGDELLVRRLVTRMLDNPTATTFAEVAALFREWPIVRQALVDLAAVGHQAPARLLQGVDLTEKQVAQLSEARPNPVLLRLLGRRNTTERLRVCLEDPELRPAATLLLLERSDRSGLPYAAETFICAPGARASLLRVHPEPALLSQEVRERVREAAQRQSGDALRALSDLGPLAAPELDWIRPLLNPRTESAFLHWLLDIVSAFPNQVIDELKLLLQDYSCCYAALKCLHRATPADREPFLPFVRELTPVERNTREAWQALVR